MPDLAEKCISILNNDRFEITNAGPLHQPLRGFSIRRDDRLRIVLETDAGPNATSSAAKRPPGTVWVSTERVQMKSLGGLDGELLGVIPRSTRRHGAGILEQWLKEESNVNIAKTNNPAAAPAVRVIDWLENLPRNAFVWPAGSRVITNTVATRTISLDDGLTISSDRENYSISYNAVKLTVGAVTFYVCAQDLEERPEGIKPGCIIYDGTPPESFRKNVRVALSFALGLYLIDLGSTHYNFVWEIVSTFARSAYNLGGHAFELHTMPLAPLGPRFLHELNTFQVTRAVTALVEAFDGLDLGNLHWAYWHACAAPPHIAPAHFGAAIEALQDAYFKANPDKAPEGWVSPEAWKTLRIVLIAEVERADISAGAQAALKEKVSALNRVDQRQRLRSLMTTLNLQLGRDEDAAWRRRNKAAHGIPIPEGQELAAIRDMKLLRGVFQRLLLRISNAADQYIDYASAHHEYRNLHEAPPDAPPPSP